MEMGRNLHHYYRNFFSEHFHKIHSKNFIHLDVNLTSDWYRKWTNMFVFCFFPSSPPAARSTWWLFYISEACWEAANTSWSCRDSQSCRRNWALPEATGAEFYLVTCRSQWTQTACPTCLSPASASCCPTTRTIWWSQRRRWRLTVMVLFKWSDTFWHKLRLSPSNKAI